jgi:hypothetical protein
MIPDALTAADISWRLSPPDPPLDLLTLTSDELAEYAYSLHEDCGILRAMLSTMLDLHHRVEDDRQRDRYRIATLVASNRDLRTENSAFRAENSTLRFRLGDRRQPA